MDLAYQILEFIKAALPVLGVIVLGLFVLLYVRRDADGQRALFALCLRALDYLLPKREAALQRAAVRDAKRSGGR